ncbi:ATP-binding protein [Lentzea sp. NPDC006480]|uniref:ATP-binding protein n=1 Tax=Lentzea sp. NPDC006480 TaxID=3157176 RepID=UPI00339DF9DA
MTTSALSEAVFSLPDEDHRGGVALARTFARRTAMICGFRGNHEDVVLVVNELATNAVCHGGGRPFVRIVGGQDRVLVEVTDDEAAHPELRSGRWGLQLVARLAQAWGVTERAGQKVVWCELTA